MNLAKSENSFAFDPTMRGTGALLVGPPVGSPHEGACGSQGTTSPSGRALKVAGSDAKPLASCIESFTRADAVESTSGLSCSSSASRGSPSDVIRRPGAAFRSAVVMSARPALVYSSRRRNVHRAGALTPDRYVLRVAAEGTDLVAHPPQPGAQVPDREVRHALRREVKEAVHGQSVVERHADEPLTGKVVHRLQVAELTVGAVGVAAAVDPNEHGQWAGVALHRRCGDV
eukprot:4325462-Prymnesium_polylepis.1